MNRRPLLMPLLVAAVGLAGPPAEAQPPAPPTTAGVCPDFVRLVEAALPREVGDAAALGKLLQPRVGPQLSRAFDPAKAAAALGDQLAAEKPCCPDPAGERHRAEQRFTAATGSTLEADLDNGRLSYLNPGRSFDAAKSADNKVERERALATALEAFRALGVPAAELDKAADVRAIKVAGRGTERGARPLVRRAEVSVLVPRRIDGTPVFDSSAKAAIDAEGRVARLHLRWPDFALAAGLTAERVRPRAEVVRELAAELSARDRCGTLERVDLHVAYVSLAELDAEPSGDDEGETAAPPPRARFVPALVVYALPRAVKEDSGELQSAGLQLVTPLFAPVRADEGKPGAGR